MAKPLPFTKATIKRAIAAAQQEGCTMIEVTPHGGIRIILRSEFALDDEKRPAQTEGDAWGPEA